MELDRLLVLRMRPQHAQRGGHRARRAPPFVASFASNSKPILPSGCRTRNAEKPRLVRAETNCSRSVLPVASSFCICARSIGRCRITRPERKSHVFSGPTAFSQTYACRDLEDARLALRARPERLLAGEIRRLAAESSPLPSPKSKLHFVRVVQAQRCAENGLPSRLRKPSSGPDRRSLSSVSASVTLDLRVRP